MHTYNLSLFKAVVAGVVVVVVLIFFLLLYFLRRQQQYRQWLKQQAAAEMGRSEDERNRLSMDLHDDLRQLLTATRLQLMLAQEDVAHAPAHAAEACRFVDELNQRLYVISRNLGSRLVSLRGLKGALEDLLQTIPGCSLQTALQYRVVRAVPPDVAIHLYRMVQELLQNAVKHSGASTVKLLLEEKAKVLRLQYRDNGSGFVYTAAQTGLGLHHLRSRIALLDGTMVCRTEPGQGTYYLFEIPKPKRNEIKSESHPRGDSR